MPSALKPTGPPIVVADTAEGFAQLKMSMTSPYPMVLAPSLAAAQRLIEADTPLVLCGCHFDEGRMYDLLRYLKASALLAAIPFMATRAVQGELDDALYESVKIATRALGADGFVDLFRWQGRYGLSDAAHRFTRRVEALAGVRHSDTR